MTLTNEEKAILNNEVNDIFKALDVNIKSTDKDFENMPLIHWHDANYPTHVYWIPKGFYDRKVEVLEMGLEHAKDFIKHLLFELDRHKRMVNECQTKNQKEIINTMDYKKRDN